MQQLRWEIAQFFESFWWKNYLKNKSTKEYLEWKKAYWHNFLDKISLSKDKLNTPIIDIGCGPAGVFCIFDKENITALDPLLSNYSKLDIFNKEFYPNVQFKEASFEKLSIENEFETIFCLNAINHFIDIDLSFKKLNQIAAKNGRLVLSIDAHNHGFFRKLFAILPFDILHPHQYNLKEYKEFLSKNGFEIEREVLIKKEFFFSYWVLVAIKN